MSAKADRLRQARLAKGHNSASSAARSLGVSVSTYVHHENGTRDYGEDAALIYGRRYNVKPAWLLFGEGDPRDETEAVDDRDNGEAPFVEESAEDKELKRDIAARSEQRRKERFLEYLRSMTLVPEINALPLTSVRLEDFTRFVSLTETVQHATITRWGIPTNHLRFELGCTPEKVIALQQTGDAMAPTLQHGAVALFDTSVDELVEDGVYAVADGKGPIFIRRLERVLGSPSASMNVISDNQRHAPQTVNVDDLLIVGALRGQITRP